MLGLLDTYETALSTSAGTAMTIEGAPWATGANSPFVLNGLLGQVIPSGALIQGSRAGGISEMSGWTSEFKKGFFTGAGVLAAIFVVGLVVKKV